MSARECVPVLWHGAAGGPRIWERVVAALTPGVSCVVVDLHASVSEPLGGGHVVAGNGVGALLAGRAALRHPAVGGVVMAGPVGLAGAGHARLRWLSTHRPGAALLRLAATTVLRRRFLRDHLADPDADPGAAAVLVASFRAARAFHRLARLNRPESLAGLRGLRCPVTVLWGERDGVLPVTRADEFMTFLPAHARLEIVPGAGHALPLERPDLVARTILGLA